MDDATSSKNVKTFYQGVHQPLMHTDFTTESNVPAPPPDNIMLETGTDNMLLEDGFNFALEQ